MRYLSGFFFSYVTRYPAVFNWNPKTNMLVNIVLWGLLAPSYAWHLEIMITSPWKNVERRNILRRALDSCVNQVTHSSAHTVTYRFFMGDVNSTQPAEEEIGREDMVK